MKKVVIVVALGALALGAVPCKTKKDLYDGCVWSQRGDDEISIEEKISYKDMQRNGIYKRYTKDFDIYAMEEWKDGEKVRVICEYGINCPEEEISWRLE